MSTLVIKAQGTILNPKYPKPLDLNDGLRVRIDARNLNASQGEALNTIEAEGSASAADRIFKSAPTNGWNAPTFDNTSKPSLKFANKNALVNTGTTLVPNCTYIFVAKVDSTNANGRLVTLASSLTDYHTISLVSDTLYLKTPGYSDAVNQYPVGQWFVFAMSVGGAESKALYSYLDGIDYYPDVPSVGQRGMAIGGRANVSANSFPSFTGNIALFAQYDKVMTDLELQQIVAHYKSAFNV